MHLLLAPLTIYCLICFSYTFIDIVIHSVNRLFMYFDVFMYSCIHSLIYLRWHIQVFIEILSFSSSYVFLTFVKN
jgi:hypothetical protein